MTGTIVKVAVRSVLTAALTGALTGALIGSAYAETTGPNKSTDSDSAMATIVVTGSYIHRTDAETPSPVSVISEEEIRKSGLTSISDVIRTSAADNGGSLSQAFSGAMAGGASGVSLRGLSVDATLVLVDGHRMAPYPCLLYTSPSPRDS